MQCQDSPTRGQPCRLWCACGLDGQSVTTGNTGLRFSQLMSSQSNLSVCEPPYSSCVHTNTGVHTTLTKAHCSHWFTVRCRRDTIYKGPPGWTLFVCLHLWLRFGSHLSHPQRQSQNTVLCTSLFGAVLWKQDPDRGTFDSWLAGRIKCLTF